VKLKIRVAFVYPPIPQRTFDWSAALDGYEPGDPLGCGPTKWEAVRDLIDQMEDREDDAMDEHFLKQQEEPSPPYDTREEKLMDIDKPPYPSDEDVF
jgi:hypothetical protein